MANNLKGKVAVISGGGSGIGREICFALAKEGVNIVVLDVHEKGALDTVSKVQDMGGNAISIVCDVTNACDVQNAFKHAVHHFGRFDICCNNAGILEEAYSFLSAKDISKQSEWKKVVDIDLTAVISCTQIAIQEMRRVGKGGVIINTASMGGFFEMPYTPVYAATKAGVIQLSRSLAVLREEGIRVNSICPSFTETAMVDKEKRDSLVAMYGGLIDPKLVAEGVVQLCKDTSKAGATMRVTIQKGIDYWDPAAKAKPKPVWNPQSKL